MIARRETLGAVATLVTVGTAGCVVGSGATVQRGSRTLSLSDGQFQTLLFAPDHEARLAYEIDGDDPVDVFLLDAAEYGYFQEGVRYEPLAAGTVTGVASASRRVRLEPDTEYHVVVDNSRRGPTAPDGSVTVRFAWRLAE